MDKVRYLSVLFLLLCSVGSWAQEDFDPTLPPDPPSPPEPVVPVQKTMLTLLASPADGGTVSGGGQYAEGEQVQLSASPATGFIFERWTLNDSTLSTSHSYLFVKGKENETVVAHFAYNPNTPADPDAPPVVIVPDKWQLTLYAEEGGSNLKGSGHYEAATSVTISVDVSSGYLFTGWYNKADSLVSATTRFVYVTLAENDTLTARFNYDPALPDDPSPPDIQPKPNPTYHNVTAWATPSDGGSVSVGSNSVAEGESTRLTATPATGFVFTGWYVADTLYTQAPDFYYTMDSLDICFEARFMYDPGLPADPSSAGVSPYSLYLPNIRALPGRTVDFPVHLVATDSLQDMRFHLTFPSYVTPHIDDIRVSGMAVGYTIECSPVPSSEVSADEQAHAGENVYALQLSGGMTPPCSTRLLTLQVTLADEIPDSVAARVKINQVAMTNKEGVEMTAATSNGNVLLRETSADGVFYYVQLIVTGQGQARVNNKTIRSSLQTIAMLEGTSANIYFYPDNGNHLARVSLDSLDVTEQSQKDGRLLIESIGDDHEIEVSFAQGASAYWPLTIVSTGHGTTTFDDHALRDSTAVFNVANGSEAVVSIVPDAGWHVAQVLLNGSTDVTSQVYDDQYVVESITAETLLSVTYSMSYAEMPVITINEADTTVTMTCPTEEAVIIYTLDGSDPDGNSAVYTEPVKLTRNCTVKAVSSLGGHLSGVAEQAVGWLTVSDVTFSYATLKLTMATATDGAAIHYTTDGSDPTAASSLYTVPIELDGQCTVKAIAIREGWNSSQVTSYSYDPAGVTCGNPVLARVEGTNVVTASTSTEGAFIHYTTDGTDPTADSGLFPEGGLTVERNMTIKAIAMRENWYPSQVTTFTVDWFKVADVEFAQEGNTVALTTLTDGATIHYTLSNISQGEQVYTEPLALTGDCTIEAWATRDGYTTSDTTRYVFHADGVTCGNPVLARVEGTNTVTASTSTEGAFIHYTTDGTDPTADSGLFPDGGLTVEHNMTIKAIALRDNWYPSQVTTFTVDWFKVADVEFAQEGNTLRLSTATAGAAIYYTQSDSEAGAQQYSEPLTLTGDCTIEAWATRDGYTTSDTTRYVFHADGVTCGNPVLTRVEGTNNVTAITSTEGAIIHYTTDGTEPTANSGIFPEGGLTVERNMTIKAIAMRESWYPSQVTTFTIDWFKVADVEFAQEGNTVALTTATDGATIHYTLSNSEAGEQIYTTPLTLTGDCTIEAWATRDGYTTSDTTRYEFAYTPVGVATYDGLVATVAGELTLDDAFAGYEGGREAAVQTIAAIVWDKDSKLTDDMLTGIDNPNLLVYVSSDELAPEGVQNVVVNGVCERLVLTDVETQGGAETGTDAAAGNGNFHAPLSFTALHAEYTHGYSLETPVGSNQGWETLALPFSVQAMTHETQGEIAPFAAMTDEGDTRKPFWLYGRGTDGTFARAAQVEAYKPYLIAMPNNGTYKAEYLLAGRVTFSAENVTVEATPDNPDLTTHDYTFLPTLQRVERAVGVYALNIGGEDERPAGSVFISNSRDVLPFECYITLHDRQDAPRLLPIQDMMENATDMEDVRTMASRQSAGSGRHDLGGRRLQERQADRTATRKAARIVVDGGKKHVSRTR